MLMAQTVTTMANMWMSSKGKRLKEQHFVPWLFDMEKLKREELIEEHMRIRDGL